ncbi:MAG: hypothetical protein ACM3X9_08390 [Bacillota bacterium]
MQREIAVTNANRSKNEREVKVTNFKKVQEVYVKNTMIDYTELLVKYQALRKTSLRNTPQAFTSDQSSLNLSTLPVPLLNPDFENSIHTSSVMAPWQSPSRC